MVFGSEPTLPFSIRSGIRFLSTGQKSPREYLKQDVDIVVVRGGGTQAVDRRVRVHRLLAPQQAEEPHGGAYRVQAH
jgi:hypothetical protein